MKKVINKRDPLYGSIVEVFKEGKETSTVKIIKSSCHDWKDGEFELMRNDSLRDLIIDDIKITSKDIDNLEHIVSFWGQGESELRATIEKVLFIYTLKQ
jgi:hypothetical protein